MTNTIESGHRHLHNTHGSLAFLAQRGPARHAVVAYKCESLCTWRASQGPPCDGKLNLFCQPTRSLPACGHWSLTGGAPASARRVELVTCVSQLLASTPASCHAKPAKQNKKSKKDNCGSLPTPSSVAPGALPVRVRRWSSVGWRRPEKLKTNS